MKVDGLSLADYHEAFERSFAAAGMDLPDYLYYEYPCSGDDTKPAHYRVELMFRTHDNDTMYYSADYLFSIPLDRFEDMTANTIAMIRGNNE